MNDDDVANLPKNIAAEMLQIKSSNFTTQKRLVHYFMSLMGCNIHRVLAKKSIVSFTDDLSGMCKILLNTIASLFYRLSIFRFIIRWRDRHQLFDCGGATHDVDERISRVFFEPRQIFRACYPSSGSHCWMPAQRDLPIVC